MAMPLGVLWLLRSDPVLDESRRAPESHFWVVSIAALTGVAIGIIVARAARDHRDARVFLVALGMMSISAIFLLHALSTESRFLNQGLAGFIWSPPLCLALGAVFFALSSIRWKDAINDWLVLNQGRLLVGWLAVLACYAVTVALFPNVLIEGLGLTTNRSGGYTVTGEGGLADDVLIVTLVVALVCYAAGAVRYYLQYRRRQSVLMKAIITGMLLFAEADAIMAFSDAWRLSWWLYHVVMALAFTIVGYGLLVQYSKRGSVHGLFEDIFLREQLEKMDRDYTGVIVALINSLEAKDKYTKGHSARVAQYALIIGREMGYGEQELQRLEQAALLHDIGKLAMPDAILHKPSGLTAEEFSVIQNHPVRGCVILRSVDSLQDKVPGVLHHHEWFDGSGYPDQLSGEDIPLDARVIAVADVFDAITSLRAYRKPITHQEALAHLAREAGTHLDADCVGKFIAGLARDPIEVTDFTPQLPVDELIPRYEVLGSG